MHLLSHLIIIMDIADGYYLQEIEVCRGWRRASVTQLLLF